MAEHNERAKQWAKIVAKAWADPDQLSTNS